MTVTTCPTCATTLPHQDRGPITVCRACHSFFLKKWDTALALTYVSFHTEPDANGCQVFIARWVEAKTGRMMSQDFYAGAETLQRVWAKQGVVALEGDAVDAWGADAVDAMQHWSLKSALGRVLEADNKS